MENKQITEVHFYQGVKFGGSVIRYISLDAGITDAALRRGNEASIMMHIGVAVDNPKSGEQIVVPFNNVAFIRFATRNTPAVEVKSKAK